MADTTIQPPAAHESTMQTPMADAQGPTSPAKMIDEEWEAESIAAAIVGAGDEGDTDSPTQEDLEKAVTQQSQITHEPATRVVTAVDWNGPDDPENPQNWPTWKKVYTTFATGSFAFAAAAATSIISPATFEIEDHFHVSRTAAILPLTLYTLGLAMGPVVAAPISETYGRNVVYKTTAPIFMLFLLGAGFSQSFGSLLICRLLAGISGGPVLAVGAGTNADMFTTRVRAVAVACFISMAFLGPGLGPVIGGFAAGYKGWRWTQWCSIFLGLVALALLIPTQETYKKIILSKRAKKLGIEGPPKPPVTGLAYAKVLITITLIRPLRMLFTEPVVLFFSLYNSFTFSVLFAFFAAYPYTFEHVYGFNLWQYGLTFLGIVVGVLLAAATAIVIDQTVFRKKWAQALEEGKSTAAPEHRLYTGMLGSLGVPIGLFWFGWTARRDVHWIVPTLAGIPFAWGNFAIFASAGLYLVDVYGPRNGASALAANGLMRYTCGAVFPLFTIQMYERLGIGWATSLLGFLSLLMLPIPWVFFKYGPSIRKRSAYVQ